MDRYSYFSLGLCVSGLGGGDGSRTEIKRGRDIEGVVCPRALFERKFTLYTKKNYIRLFEPFDVDYHWN